ncbi:MAG: hypothetical protein GXX90_01320 [Microbacteriaceae bacterium]|nr:hypothetical protein [Microbacteriaceae bacterium]
MTAALRFDDPRLRDDLATYFGRAGRIEDGAVRVQQLPGPRAAVALWVPVLRPAGILDRSPLVIGVRAVPARIEDADEADLVDGLVDAVVPLRGFLDRLAREPADADEARRIPLPPERLLESWTGRRPPLGGWTRVAELSTPQLRRIADEGIAEVAAATSGGLIGQVLAERARTETWTRPLPDRAFASAPAGAPAPPEGAERPERSADPDAPPAGIAFAAQALGFLAGDAPSALAAADGWWRLAAPAGQVLAQRRDAG